ncbi:hypothetical protein LCM20_09350 [Halobacillus litoralis]|uniref:hypothetical protein n=1 Tax=Halobacillus litoralis TaxID=45668 RepID=UPI001CD26B0A|nr:hypothetical protein [Halobacillus litoralis]MCA0970794.1 hypothetical protein [Halobacillus litoralis]
MNKKVSLMISGMILAFCSCMFYFQLSTYSLLPPEEGGADLHASFRQLWASSVWFYGVLFSLLAILYMGFNHIKFANEK